MSAELPAAWRRNFDLFEIGFGFLFLPLVVSTMDRPPFHLGGLILLWLATWFLLRDQNELLGEMKESWRSFRLPWSPLWLAALALVGALASRHDHRSAGALAVPFFAIAFSLPLCLLCFRYAPRRFASRGWLSPGLLPLLSPFLFLGLHIASGSWRVCAIAFAGAWVLRRWPLWAAVAAHAAVGWWGTRGALW